MSYQGGRPVGSSNRKPSRRRWEGKDGTNEALPRLERLTLSIYPLFKQCTQPRLLGFPSLDFSFVFIPYSSV